MCVLYVRCIVVLMFVCCLLYLFAAVVLLAALVAMLVVLVCVANRLRHLFKGNQRGPKEGGLNIGRSTRGLEHVKN